MRKPIAGFPGYEVDDSGTVWTEWKPGVQGKQWVRSGTFRAMTPSLTKDGYHRVMLREGGRPKGRTIHSLVLEAFVGPRQPGMQACHNNGINTDNRLQNLRWDTPSNNQRDRFLHGTHSRGERSGNTSLSNEQVLMIHERIIAGGRTCAISREFGVSDSIVSGIKRGTAWSSVTGVERRKRRGVMASLQDRIRDAHVLFGQHAQKKPSWPNDEVVQFRWDLVDEEVNRELLPAIEARDLPAAADAIVDSIYVLVGMGLALGLDLDPLFTEVHKCNLAKAGGPRREDGKQLKPANWKPPRVKMILHDQGWDGH